MNTKASSRHPRIHTRIGATLAFLTALGVANVSAAAARPPDPAPAQVRLQNFSDHSPTVVVTARMAADLASTFRDQVPAAGR